MDTAHTAKLAELHDYLHTLVMLVQRQYAMYGVIGQFSVGYKLSSAGLDPEVDKEFITSVEDYLHRKTSVYVKLFEPALGDGTNRTMMTSTDPIADPRSAPSA